MLSYAEAVKQLKIVRALLRFRHIHFADIQPCFLNYGEIALLWLWVVIFANIHHSSQPHSTIKLAAIYQLCYSSAIKSKQMLIQMSACIFNNNHHYERPNRQIEIICQASKYKRYLHFLPKCPSITCQPTTFISKNHEVGPLLQTVMFIKIAR